MTQFAEFSVLLFLGLGFFATLIALVAIAYNRDNEPREAINILKKLSSKTPSSPINEDEHKEET